MILRRRTDRMVEVLLVDVAVGGVAGAIYGGAAYFKQREGQTPEPFDPIKLGTTVIIGAAVGVAVANAGMQVSENVIGNGLMIGATMGFTSLVENALKTVYRAFAGGTG